MIFYSTKSLTNLTIVCGSHIKIAANTSTVIVTFRLKKKKRKTSVSSSIILHMNGFS